MGNAYLTKSYLDHFLQADIIARLVAADGPVRFKDLKEEGIENSLFMYHANKLKGRGLIAKEGEGFVLTTKGARWVNAAGVGNFNPQPAPRPLVQLLVIDSQQNLLLSSRKGQLKTLLNEHMLPGGNHVYGLHAEEVAMQLCNRLFKESERPQFRSVIEVIHRHKDDFIHHAISHVFALSVPCGIAMHPQEHYAYEWVHLTHISPKNKRLSDNTFLLQLTEKLLKGTFSDHEVFDI